MGYHYDPLLALFDGWILILLVALTVLAGVRLRGHRRLFVAVGFGLWALATALWLPPIQDRLFEWLQPVLGNELALQAPLAPWLTGAFLLTAGVLLAPKAPVASAYPPPPSAYPSPPRPTDNRETRE